MALTQSLSKNEKEEGERLYAAWHSNGYYWSLEDYQHKGLQKRYIEKQSSERTRQVLHNLQKCSIRTPRDARPWLIFKVKMFC
jgi:hypothetical protein